MFEIAALLIFAVYGVASNPTILYSKPLVVEDGPSVPHLPGVANLGEKSLPIVQAQRTALPGSRNNAERIQVDLTEDYRGNANIAEKAIPERILLRSHHHI